LVLGLFQRRADMDRAMRIETKARLRTLKATQRRRGYDLQQPRSRRLRALPVRLTAFIAFSSEVGTGSCKENASNKESTLAALRPGQVAPAQARAAWVAAVRRSARRSAMPRAWLAPAASGRGSGASASAGSARVAVGESDDQPVGGGDFLVLRQFVVLGFRHQIEFDHLAAAERSLMA